MKDDSMERSREPQQPEASGPTGPREWHQQTNRALQTFDHVSVTGDARGHFGNVYHNVYYGTRKRSPSTEGGEATHTQKKKRPSEEEKLDDLVRNLKFDGMKSRLETISPAHAETCHWIFRTPQYLRWQDDAYRHEHHGSLWIKGHPGSGKSTLVKYALGVALENATSEIIVHFFFDAQGSELLEKSVEGMYRSLLYQIFQARPWLTAGLRMLASKHWPTELLKNMLRNVIRSLKPEDSLTCYIDALDECIGDEIRDAVAFFEDLGDLVVTNNIRFRLCLSSRHFPHITMHKHEELKLDTQTDHLAGIVQYSRMKLCWLDLVDSTMHDILTEIRNRCSGVFLWAALVIKILRERHDCGASQTELMRSLEQVPEGLDQLFARILSNPDEALIACFQWVLFSGERTADFYICSLSNVQQLYFAIKTSTGKLTTGRWDHDAIDARVMERFIVHSSRGLIELTSGYFKFRFIHESIEEYLRTGGLARLMNIEKNALKGASHSRLAQSCLAYLQLDASKYLPGSEQMPTLEEHEFPLCPHAQYCALKHMEIAYQEGFLEPEAICDVPLELLVCAWNLRSQEALQAAAKWCTSTLSIFLRDKATLLYMLLKSRCRGLAKAMLICRGEAVMKTTYDETRADVIFDVDAICGSYWETALSLAVDQFDTDLVRILLEQGAAADGRIESSNQPSLLERVMCDYYGVWRGIIPEHVTSSSELLSCINEIARLLLDHDAPIDEWQICSPLHWAALSSNLEMIRSLLKHGANVDARCDWDDTPLMGAAHGGRVDGMVIETLLQSGADVNAVTSRHYLFTAPSALIFASETGQENTTRLLLQYGANPHHRTKLAEHAPFEYQGYLFRPDGTALGVALAKRNVNVARMIWQAEASSRTTIVADSRRSETGEWDFMCTGLAQRFWDDTKSESSSMSERKPSSRGYAKYRRAHSAKTPCRSDDAAMRAYWQSKRSHYLSSRTLRYAPLF